jgi:hypothetical protein
MRKSKGKRGKEHGEQRKGIDQEKRGRKRKEEKKQGKE